MCAKLRFSACVLIGISFHTCRAMDPLWLRGAAPFHRLCRCCTTSRVSLGCSLPTNVSTARASAAAALMAGVFPEALAVSSGPLPSCNNLHTKDLSYVDAAPSGLHCKQPQMARQRLHGLSGSKRCLEEYEQPFTLVPSAQCDRQQAKAACSQAGLYPAAIAHTPDKQPRQCLLPVQ